MFIDLLCLSRNLFTSPINVVQISNLLVSSMSIALLIVSIIENAITLHGIFELFLSLAFSISALFLPVGQLAKR